MYSQRPASPQQSPQWHTDLRQYEYGTAPPCEVELQSPQIFSIGDSTIAVSYIIPNPDLKFATVCQTDEEFLKTGEAFFKTTVLLDANSGKLLLQQKNWGTANVANLANVGSNIAELDLERCDWATA